MDQMWLHVRCQCSTAFFNPLGLGPKNSGQECVFLWTLQYMPCKCSALGAPVSVNPHTSIQCTICVWDTYHVHGYAWGHTSIYILFSVCLMHDQKSLKPCKRSNHIQWAPCMPVILQTSMSPRPRSYHEHPPEEFEFKCEISVEKLKYKICPH